MVRLFGFIITNLVAFVVPHSPDEVAVIAACPKYTAFQSITPEIGSIVPAVIGKTEYAIEVLLAAVAVYFSFGAS